LTVIQNPAARSNLAFCHQAFKLCMKVQWNAFIPGPVSVGFAMDEVTVRHAFLFCLSITVFPCQHNHTNSLYSFIHLSPLLYSLLKVQNNTKKHASLDYPD